MDKYDIVLDLVEHPDRYTPEQTAQVLSEPEVREICNLLSKTASACNASEDVADAEVDAEWRRLKPRPRLRWYGSRAASIAVFALSSLVAVGCLFFTTPSPPDRGGARMPPSACKKKTTSQT